MGKITVRSQDLSGHQTNPCATSSNEADVIFEGEEVADAEVLVARHVKESRGINGSERGELKDDWNRGRRL